MINGAIKQFCKAIKQFVIVAYIIRILLLLLLKRKNSSNQIHFIHLCNIRHNLLVDEFSPVFDLFSEGIAAGDGPE